MIKKKFTFYPLKKFKSYNTVLSAIVTIYTLYFHTLLIAENLYSLTKLCSPYLQFLVTIFLLCLWVWHFFFQILLVGDMIFVFSWLISVSIISSRFIHVVVSHIISFFKRLNSIQLHMYMIFSLSIYFLMNSWVESTPWLLSIMMQWTWE